MVNFKESKFIEKVEFVKNDIDSKTLTTYPFNVPSLKYLSALELNRSVTFLVGENGTGKSTLLEAIAVSLGLNPEGGSKNFNFSTRESHSELFKHLKIYRGLKRPKDYYYLRAESFYNVATNIENLDKEAEESGGYGRPIRTFFGGKSLHEMSHGESFFTLIMERFINGGLYLLDEPEAALSSDRQMAMISRIHDLCKNGAQFIIATHSPIILSYPNSTIYSVENDGIVEKDYEDTDQYITTKNFLNNYQSMLKILLEGEDDV